MGSSDGGCGGAFRVGIWRDGFCTGIWSSGDIMRGLNTDNHILGRKLHSLDYSIFILFLFKIESKR